MTELEKAAEEYATEHEPIGYSEWYASTFDFTAGAQWQLDRIKGVIESEIIRHEEIINTHIAPHCMTNIGAKAELEHILKLISE